jgi:hypothetical protein
MKMAAKEVIMKLQHSFDLIGLRHWLGNKTKFGREKHKSDRFGFTREFLSEYVPDCDQEEIIGLFKAQGATNDNDVGIFLLRNDKLID